MKRNLVLPGAIVLLALSLGLNALATLMGRPGESNLATPAPAISVNDAPGFYYLGRDTYFMTSSSDGKKVYLWYYDYSPQMGDNSVKFLKSATGQ